MSADRKDLFGDFQRMDRVLSNNSGNEYNIQVFNATPKEVRDWYRAQDPLSELEIIQAMRGLSTNNRHHKREFKYLKDYKSVAYEKGSAILVANAIFPELYIDGPFEGYRKLEEKVTQETPPEQIVDSKAMLSADDIIGFSLKELRNNQDIRLTDSNLRDLFSAAEMSHIAAMIGLVKPANRHQSLTPHKLNEYVAVILYGEVARRAQESSDLNTRILGLRARVAELSMAMLYLRRKPEPHKKEIYEEHGKILLRELVDNLESVFLSGRNIDFKNNEIRGTLHEMMWFLDFSMLLMHEDKENRIFIFPSKTFQDFPISGVPREERPKENRAFDFSLAEVDYGAMCIQIKSRPKSQEQKLYHPVIKVVKERNFQDVNPGRLTKKIRKYREYIDTQNEELWQSIRRDYVLESVNEVWGQISQMPHIPFHLETFKTSYVKKQKMPKNNSARRRLIKEMRELGMSKD
jgi:hypothetical protein